MRVCDHCKQGIVAETIIIRGRHYDLCEQCLSKIISYLNTPMKAGLLSGLFK